MKAHPGLQALFAPSQKCLCNSQSNHVTSRAITLAAAMRVLLAFRYVVVTYPDNECVKKGAILPSQSHVQKSLGGHRCTLSGTTWRKGERRCLASRLLLCGEG